MKKTISKALIMGIIATSLLACNEQTKLETGHWIVNYDEATDCIDVYKSGVEVYNDLYTTYRYADTLVSTQDYKQHTFDIERINDDFGEGYKYEVVYEDDKLPTLIQALYLYPEKDYFLTDITLQSDSVVSTNYMAPICIDDMRLVLAGSENNRALFIPFDNDCWIRYASHPLSFESLTSYEVTSIFDNESRYGIVVGSIEHDTWKSAVVMTADSVTNELVSLRCVGGVADELTRDSKEHGAVSGNAVKSPKVLVGAFSDWRDGMDTYALVNAIVAPPKAWDKAMPFGWNSWGALQFRLTAEKALEVSDFYHEHLQSNHFYNADSVVYTGLDSGWNSFTEEQLRAFVERCKLHGQKAGIYWTPFVHWGRNPKQVIEHGDGYKFEDVYLYANGKHQELDGGRAIDPTHPAIEATMKYFSDLFRRLGYEYVKLDFMTHGAMEADKWYNPDIQTGMQAYNYGLKLVEKYFGDMYINFSISPAFPAQYAQSRRIACDAWNKIKDTEYTLNALSYGWWLDKVYQYNDPDHIVLREATEGENRARVTSGVITGIFIAGDDFSAGGPQEAKERAKKYLTNAEINAIATGISFRPVEGNGEKSENSFVRIDSDSLAYYAIFNYGEEPMTTQVSLERIGLDATQEYRIKELWSGAERSVATSFDVAIPAADVAVFRIEK